MQLFIENQIISQTFITATTHIGVTQQNLLANTLAPITEDHFHLAAFLSKLQQNVKS